MKTIYILSADRDSYNVYARTIKQYVKADVKIVYIETYEQAENVIFDAEDRLYATKYYWANFDHYEIMLRLRENNPNFNFEDVY